MGIPSPCPAAPGAPRPPRGPATPPGPGPRPAAVGAGVAAWAGGSGGSCSLGPGRDVTLIHGGSTGAAPAVQPGWQAVSERPPRTQGRPRVSAVCPFAAPSSIIAARRAQGSRRARLWVGEEELKSQQLHSMSAPGNLGWEQPKALLQLPGAFPPSPAWRLHLSQGTAVPEECQITGREVSNPCRLPREINQGHIHGIPDRNPRMGSSWTPSTPSIAVTGICHCGPYPLHPSRVQAPASCSAWNAVPPGAGIELVWRSSHSGECHCWGHIWRSHCPSAAGRAGSSPRKESLPWPWKTIRTSSGVQASWTQFEELPVPNCGFSLKLKHLHGSPGNLGAARSQQLLCLD
ncbi:uncharacterized protein LOC134551734 [Prinia subflava]|uniref:uncharacterized protein LOC134551734 n=1 Tax=Prinia subflava TaxID=208062 RepID=UPI002FE00898